MGELLTLVYTSQQNTLQHIPYPGTTKPCEWHIWHLRKLFRESTGIYNYYTIKQVSTHTDISVQYASWQWCQMQLQLPHGNWIHSFSSIYEWPQSTFLSLLSHPITYPTNHWPLTSLLQSAHLPFPLSVVMNQKSKTQACNLVNLSTVWTSTKANRNQIGKPLQFWWGSFIPVYICFL